MFKIAEWNERYEVSSKGREPKPGEDLRAGPLQYIRLKVYGHSQGTGYRRMKSTAGAKAMEVFGIFCKFLEISGNQPKGMRGTLLNENDEPATIPDLAFILDVPEKQIENALNVLCSENVGWLTNSTQLNSIQPTQPTQGAGKTPASPEIPGKSPKSSKTKHLDYVLLKPEEYDKLVAQFGVSGVKDRIESLNLYIGSKGKKYKSHYHTILAWEKRNGRDNGKTIQTNQQKSLDFSKETCDYGFKASNED